MKLSQSVSDTTKISLYIKHNYIISHTMCKIISIYLTLLFATLLSSDLIPWQLCMLNRLGLWFEWKLIYLWYFIQVLIGSELYNDICYRTIQGQCHCDIVDNKFNDISLRWRHNGRDSVSNHQPHDCLLSRLFRRRSKKISKFRVTGLCAGNSPGTGEFPAQMASNAENVSIWWRHHVDKLNHLNCRCGFFLESHRYCT